MREYQDAIALVDDGTLFGHQIHPIHNRIDEQHIIPLHRRKRPRTIIATERMNRCPVLCAVFPIDRIHHVKHPGPVTLVDG